MIHFPVPTIIWCKSGDRIKNTELPEFGGWTPPTSEGRCLRRPRTAHDEPKALGNRSIQFSGILRLDFSVRTGWYLGVASDAPSERRAQLYGFAKTQSSGAPKRTDGGTLSSEGLRAMPRAPDDPKAHSPAF
jgi:hypothetical protein